ncbi:MAG: GIY-YIG nuclease family protein [bacterium]|nr:GIY-YIG nuclease family protein [bacterium]
MAFYVYVLKSELTEKIYIGETSDLNNRIKQHNDPECWFTEFTKKNAGPWRLVYKEEYPTRKDAMRREKELKSGQGREWLHKNILIDNLNDSPIAQSAERLAVNQ